MATKKTATEEVVERTIAITPSNMQRVRIKIVGTAPYMQCRFTAKAMQAMADSMTGVTKKGTKAREPRNFEEDYQQAMHISMEGWNGIPANSIRNACISACRVAGFVMARAKLSIFVDAEGLDKVDGLPLIRIYGDPEPTRMAVRLAGPGGAADIRVRPMWRKWEAYAWIEYDGDQFSLQDVINLLDRAGKQVGIGEGRPDSKASAGLGFGKFQVEQAQN